MIAIPTVRGIQEKLKSKGTIVSVGNLMALKSFFINYATEQEHFLKNNWDSLHARLNSHYKAWSYKKKKLKKIKVYRKSV